MKTASAPIVSVVLAVRDGERFLVSAIRSVLRQTVRDLELIVVDDGSRDATPEILAAVDDPRLVVLRSDASQGLASSLNRALDHASGRYVARMDADDVALPHRLERQLGRLGSSPQVGIVGAGVLELDPAGRLGRLHVHPAGTAATRWQALFGTPFFHPTVVVDRTVLDSHGLRYDGAYDAGDASTEDYDLWARLLVVAEGDNIPDALLLYRRHRGQASERRQEHQRELRRRIALREIGAAAPDLSADEAELAWLLGDAQPLPGSLVEQAAGAYLELLERFSRRYERDASELRGARQIAARSILRASSAADPPTRARLLRRASSLDRAVAFRSTGRRVQRRLRTKALRRRVGPWLETLGAAWDSDTQSPVSVAYVSPEPTPFRVLLLDRCAARPELDLTVIYAGRTVARRTWTIDALGHRAVFLDGFGVPGAWRILHHDYPVTVGIWRELRRARPDVVVVSGWSTFACQAAVVWCRLRSVPYILLVESHDRGPRAGWRRAVKGAVVPPIVRRAARILVIGSLAGESMLARGARPQDMRVFADTIDVGSWGERADRLAGRRPELRAGLGLADDDVAVLSVARLAPEKGVDTLVRAVAGAGDRRLVLVLAGDGPERDRLEALARELGVGLVLVGDLPWEQIIELYVACDVFALLSRQEPWAVVVNEAAACGLPLVLSDHVGAAPDLLRDGENGVLVPAGDVAAAARALRSLAADRDARLRAGARSRAIVAGWGYGPSVENLVAAVREATATR